MRNVGKALVWINNNVSEAGDYCTDKAKNDDTLDKFLEKVQREKELHNKRRARRR